MKSYKETMLSLWKYISNYKFHLISSLFFAVALGVLTIVAPFLSGKIIDNMIGENAVEFNNIIKIILILSAVYFLTSFFQWLLLISTNVVANKSVGKLRKALFERIGKMPLNFYDTRSHGDVLSHLSNDMDAISEGLLQGITQFFSGIITILGSLVFMFFLNPVIAVIVVVITIIAYFIADFIVKGSNKTVANQQKTVGKLNGYIEESISNIKTLKAFRAEKQSIEGFKELNKELYFLGQKAQFFGSLVNPTTRFINNTAYIFVGLVGGIFGVTAGLTTGTISALLLYATQFAKPINEIAGVSMQIQTAVISAQRVFKMLDEEVQIPEQKNELVVKESSVVFENVSFSYIEDRPLINNLNLEVKPNNIVAIVGPTGAGKTTFVNLLMRFYDVTSGRILIDGTDIKTVTRSSLRNNFAMVLQETWLFEGTVRENISYGKENATLNDVIRAAKEARAHSFIKRLPDGYDTKISGGDSQLSSGQKQLLTIARAMLLNPPLLILDEATSSVDTRTEVLIQQAFKKMMNGRTSFVIAHRLSTIINSDLILVMDKGAIIESGTHEQLLKKKGFYYKLYSAS